MEFYSASEEKRPVRLKESVRKWAWESLRGKYGDEAQKNRAVALDDIAGFEALSPWEQQDISLVRVAESAPLRLCENEQVCGAATLGLGIEHLIPVTIKGKPVLPGISHLTPDYHRALTRGMDSYRSEIGEKLNDGSLPDDKRQFILSLGNVINALAIYHARYLAATESARPDLHSLLTRVPFSPARTFREAVQSLWFLFSFMRLCGNWPGIGRIDWLLGDYLARDLAEKRITMDEAREVLASFFIKGCEWIRSDAPVGSGDAQHYQNIVLGGTDASGNDITNEVSYLVLDVVEELPIGDFPITIRVNQKTPDRFLTRAAEVVRHGGGVIAFYCEETVLAALRRAGYPEGEIWKFANDGCWEVQLPGETKFGYLPFDALQILDHTLGVDRDTTPAFGSTEELYQAFLAELRKVIARQFADNVTDLFQKAGDSWHVKANDPWRGGVPCSVISLFTDGCLESAHNYFEFGPHYSVTSPHIGGAPDVGNSLHAIDRLVFREKRMTLEELVACLRDNWEGHEAERLQVRSRITCYGNDDDEADRYTARLLNDFADIVTSFHSDVPMKFVPGVSTFGRQIEWLPRRHATAFGARQGAILSGNASPTPGTDERGATAIIRSCCKADLTRQTTGAALDVKLFPGSLAGENSIAALKALVRGFCALGGYFMQLDVVDAAVLRAAQQDPETYKTLSVRVSGWNARFVTLDRQWQDMIIERTAQNA